MNHSARRTQLEHEFERIDLEYKAALRELGAAARERTKLLAAVEPLKPFETPQSPDYPARVAVRERFEKWDAEVKRLRTEHRRLGLELDRCG